MSKKIFQTSELFVSIEGEGPYTGRPTVYARFTKCNFECRGFNNPEGLDTTSHAVMGFDPKQYKSLAELPPIVRGCDSIYSWHNDFKHMWSDWTVDELAEALNQYDPGISWVNEDTGSDTILSLTGGEPTLRAKFIPQLLNHDSMKGLKILLIETNCAVPLTDKFIAELAAWTNAPDAPKGRRVVWSNSPKLSVSGEKHDEAIRPDIALKQLGHPAWEQYFKFVSGPSKEEFEEIERIIQEYREAGIDMANKVYIMPVACVNDQQQNIASLVAGRCIKKGYTYCHRVHLDVFDNAIGT